MKKFNLFALLFAVMFFVNNSVFSQSSNCIVDLSSYWASTPDWTHFSTVPTPASSVCVGETLTFNITLDGTYAWDIVGNYPNPNGYIQGGNGNVINRTTPMLNIPGDYEFKIIVYGTGCNRDTTLHVAVLGAPTNLTLTANPGNAVCAGTDVEFTAVATNAQPGSSTYKWFVGGFPVPVADSTSNIFNYTPSHGQTITYSIANGDCVATLPPADGITMTVYDNPTPVVSFDNLNSQGRFCNTQIATINETSGNANITSWRYFIAGTPTTTTSNTRDWTINMAQHDGQDAYVVVTDGQGCTGTSNVLTINVDALPDLSVAPIPSNTCNGEEMKLRVSGFTGMGPWDLEVWNTAHTIEYPIMSSTPNLPTNSGPVDISVDVPYGTPFVHVKIKDNGTGCESYY